MHKMFRNQGLDDVNPLLTYANPLQEGYRNGYPHLRMHRRSPTARLKHSCHGLAKVVTQGGKYQNAGFAGAEPVTPGDQGCLITHQKRVDPDVTFRMPFRILRRPLECRKFRKENQLAGIRQCL
jgi:hypothetical protein